MIRTSTTTFCNSFAQLRVGSATRMGSKRTMASAAADYVRYVRECARKRPVLDAGMNLCREKDPEMFATAGYMGANLREHFLTCRALNAEVAAIPEATRGNTETAALRFQFWRGLVKDASDGRQAAPHPLLPSIERTLRASRAEPEWLLRMIDARERDMDPQSRPYASLRDLEAYADDTQGALLMYLLDSTAPPQQSQGGEACITYAGRAIGLATLLRGFVYHAARGDCYLPSDVLAKHGLTASEAMVLGSQGRSTAPSSADDRLTGAVFDVASLANAYAEDCWKEIHHMPEQARPAVLPLVSSQMWLEKLQEHHFDVFEPALLSAVPKLKLHWRLLKSTIAHA